MRLASIHTYPIKGCHRLDHDDAWVQPWGLADDRRWMIVGPDLVGFTQRQDNALVAVRPRIQPGGVILRAAGRPELEVKQPADGEPLEVRVFSHRDPVPVRAADPAADAWLSELFDRPVRLVWLADPTVRPIADPPPSVRPGDRVSFADAYPLLLTNSASLDAVNDALRASDSPEGPLPMTRFRPNVVVSGADRWAEDGWIGRRLRIGAVVFRAAKTCARCRVTTIDQETGTVGREPLRVLGVHRRIDQGLLFGINLVPDGGADGADATPTRLGVPDASLGRISVGDPVELLD